jgi:hypothetical protein
MPSREIRMRTVLKCAIGQWSGRSWERGLALRVDGSVAATRVAVADLAAVNVRRGPLLTVSNAEPIL